MGDYETSSRSVNIICEETVRYSFVSHLSAALRREGISVFADTYLDYRNQEARVSVVVFSETFAFSVPWIDNFAKVLELRSNNGHKVIPVYYGVDPSVIDQEWMRMLLETGYSAGHQSRNSSDMIRSDSQLVEDIVRDVYRKLSPTERIGIYPRLMEIENLICEQSWHVRTLGIWGMPGIGKTTLAKALFDHMSNDYDASCFIESFDEQLHKEGPHRLLEEKIGKILEEKFGVSSSYMTRLSLLRDKLCDTRILVVLDDVRNPLVAQSFLGRLDWFGPGSVIILTSRYKQVFAVCQISHIYEVQGLYKHEALQLFSQSAFETDVPEQNDKELSMKVIDYANGNPLALCTYGRELKGKKSKMEAAFLNLKQFPPQKIQDALKSVYSALGDNEKYIFLDIACFFKGENLDYVVQLLKGCGYFPRVGIDVLVEKCLVTISGNTLHINDLIQDIFQEIIVGEKIQMEMCTTLWQPSSIRYLLEDDELKADGEPKETPKCLLVAKDIEGISLDTSSLIFDVNPDAFKKLLSLRFLKVYNSYSESVHGLNFPKGLNSLPCALRLLHWENYPFESLPQGFDFLELVELNMPYSQLKNLKARTKNIETLKRIRLCHSQQLVNFSIHEYTQNIELIDLQGCTRLESFPTMKRLQHLRVLNLSGCSNIKIIPALPPNIEELYLQGTSIEELPKSIVAWSSQPNCKELMNHIKHFPGLEHIDLKSVKNLITLSSYNQGIGKLVRLSMKDCFQLQSLPDMFNLETLQVLDLSGCLNLEEIKRLPRNMKELYVAGTDIQELPYFPGSLEFLNAHDCDRLKTVDLRFEELPRHYTFSNCFSLSLETSSEFLKKGLTRAIQLVKEQNQEHNKAPAFNICFPADVCPGSFHWQASPFAMVELAPFMRKALSGFAMSVIVSFWDDCHNDVGLGIRCICTWETKEGHFDRIEKVFKCWAPTEAPRVAEDHIFFLYDAEIHPGAGERMDQNVSADEFKFEFQTVSGENKPLGANCLVTDCCVEVIMNSKGVTSLSVVSRASEDISTVEELRPQEKICSPPSSKPHKLSTVASKVKSKRNVFSRWVGCVPRVRKIKRDNKKDLDELVAII
nr:CHS3 protein [Arabidopsis thaliana]